MGRSIITFAIFASLLISGALRADQPERKNYQAEYQSCLSKSSPVNNGVVVGCAEAVSAEAKSEMNALYKTLRDNVMAGNQDDVAELDKAQKAWLTYRNSHCELAGKYVGEPDSTYCSMELNIERVNELRELTGTQ